MASKKKKAQKAGAGALGAAQAARSNPYVQRLVEDEDLRDNLRTAFDSVRNAYERIANGKGPAKAILDDKKTQKELREAANSLKDAADSLRGAKRRRRGGVTGRNSAAAARRRARAGALRGPAQEGPRRPLRRGGGVRVHIDHHAADRHAAADAGRHHVGEARGFALPRALRRGALFLRL